MLKGIKVLPIEMNANEVHIKCNVCGHEDPATLQRAVIQEQGDFKCRNLECDAPAINYMLNVNRNVYKSVNFEKPV